MKYYISCLICICCFATVSAQKTSEKVYLDNHGTIRWTADHKEVALFGANYCLPSACDYRAAGYVSNDRKKMIDQDMVHFARMGWDGIRFSFWGDYENTDKDGNLVNNDHLDLLDYLIARAKERGIYMLLSPIVTYSSQWPDAMGDTTSAKGFSTYFQKSELGTNPKAIAAQVNYLKQLLNHVNPYTKTSLKDEPNILFVEMINEPWHHSNDAEGSVKYINALVDAVRSTGCNKLLFHNISQDFNMAVPLQKSKIQGASFAWYPSGLNSGHTLQGNYLPVVDDFSLMLKPELSKMAKIVYEFDSPDLLTGYMYPAMARTFRSVGAQFAAIFSYDMLATAPYNLGWQTHVINMVYTPNKAISGIISAEVMRTIPAYKNYGKYPANTSFGPFKLSYKDDLGEMLTDDKFLYTNTTNSKPVNPGKLSRIVGHGSSPVINYEGKGIYFLDKVKKGVWRLEVYPDVVEIDDPFKMPSPGKVVFRSISRNWPMKVNLPDLGTAFTIKGINHGNAFEATARDAEFGIEPGVYILTIDKKVSLKDLPAKIGYIGMTEFVSPEDQKLPVQLVLKPVPQYETGKPVSISAEVYSSSDPESVTLFVKSSASGRFFSYQMKKDKGYTYQAEIPADKVQEGWIDYCIVVKDRGQVVNFPSGINKSPDDWDYYGGKNWTSGIVKPDLPLRLLNPAEDVSKLAFTRIGDNVRFGIFKMIPASNSAEPAFKLELPLSYDKSLEDYTISVPVKDKIESRGVAISNALFLELNARGLSEKQEAFITLVENDGTSWAAKIPLNANWTAIKIPLNQLKLSKGVMLPLGYPGRWNYWFSPAVGRGQRGDTIHIENIERLQLSIRPSETTTNSTNQSWIEITSASLGF